MKVTPYLYSWPYRSPVPARFAQWLLLVGVVGLGACGTMPIDDEAQASGSTVEYLPRTAATGHAPSRPPAPTRTAVSSAPATYVPVRGRTPSATSSSGVRYEPIRRPDAITSEALWGHNDDHDALDAELGEPAHADHRNTGDTGDTDRDTPSSSADMDYARPRDDTPLEDRPAAKRPRKERRDQALDASVYGPRLIDDGLAFPYPATKFFRGFGPCRGKKHHHEGIDLGGVGPEWGIGTPIRSMAKAEILFIGTGDQDPEQFGSPDKRPGEALRGDKMLPRMKEIEGYGKVYFFTRTKGRWRSGNIMVTRAIDGPMAGHTIRYLHLAAFRPDLQVGSVLEVGEELGLMGGTGVQESAPHLHLDIAAPNGKRVDVAPLVGLAPTASCKNRDDQDEPRVLADKGHEKPSRIRNEKRVAEKRRDEDGRDEDSRDEDNETVADKKPVADRRRNADKGDNGDKDDKPVQLAARSPSRSRDPYAHIDKADKAESRVDSHETHAGGRLELTRCKATTRTDDFASGRFSRHAFEVELAKKGTFSVEVKRAEGDWKPRLNVSGGEARSLASGKLGGKAVASVKADEGTLKIEITGWDGKPPTDASYTLVVKEKCRR